MASGQQRFEDEDWLGSYLSTSKYASDPKLSAEPKTKSRTGFFSSAKKTPTAPPSATPTSSSSASHPADADSAAGYNLAAQSRASNRRRSWAAPPSGLPGGAHRPNPAEAAAAKAIAAAQAAAGSQSISPKPESSYSVSTRGQASTGAAVTSTATSAYVVPPPPFPNHGAGDITSALQIAAAKVVNSASVNAAAAPATGKRAAPLPGYAEPGLCRVSQSEWHEELTDKTTNFRRKSFSGSGRRVSLDYTDLEAVKERVQQAASLWAVAEDAERESLSSNEAGGNARPERTGARSAAAQAQAMARAIRAGEMQIDDDDESTDDEMDEDELPQKLPAQAGKSPAPDKSQPAAAAQTAPAQPAKKGSLIKKWLVFKK